jgi:hypothetical protein
LPISQRTQEAVKQKENFLWGIFKNKLDQDAQVPQQLQKQIELELQLEEQQSKKRMTSSYSQTEKKVPLTLSLPAVHFEATPVKPTKVGIESVPSDELSLSPEAFFDKRDLHETSGVNLTFTNDSLNQTVDTFAISQGLSQFRGTTLKIARKLKQLEKEREGLVEKLLTTSIPPE